MVEINGPGNYALPTEEQQKTKSGGLFDQDTFLKLLVAQLQNPNPFAPPEMDQMMNQAAQFGVIERLIGLEQEMRTLNRSFYMARAAELIGREVVVASGNNLLSGTVERVTFNEEGANMVIDGKEFDINAVVEVR